MTLCLLDLFSGIGGFSYAAEKLVGGFQTTQFVEMNPYCQKILRKHWPTVPIYDDITAFTPERGSADVVCGGFPCQDISIAGKQAGIKEGTRSGLFYELMRVVRLVQPQFVVLENVSAILTNGLDTVLGELAQAGFDAEWACIPASAVGACHLRKRIWIIAYQSGRQKLFTDSNSLHSERRGETEYMARKTRASKGVCQERKRDGNAFNNRGANVVHANRQGLQGRESVFVPEHSVQWVAGAGNSQLLSADWRTYVSEPVLRRGDDGLSGRVDRLKALGNAVVPQVAAIPLQRVLDLSTAKAGDDGPKQTVA